MPTAAINDVHLYYETRGAGVPLLLIAGLASDSQSWQPVIGDLARRCQVIAFDNRGVGRTTPSHLPVTIQQLADDCIALIRHLGLSTVNMLGHSMGGFAAMDCAIRYPASVDRLILAATSARNSKRNNALFSDWAAHLESGIDPGMWFRNFFYWIFSMRFFENEEAVNEAVRLAVEYPFPQSKVAFRNQVQAIAAFDCLEDLPRIASKTLVVCGKEDLLFPPEECAKLSAAIPAADFSLIEHAAHAIHIENPAAFTRCVLDFLSR